MSYSEKPCEYNYYNIMDSLNNSNNIYVISEILNIPEKCKKTEYFKRLHENIEYSIPFKTVYNIKRGKLTDNVDRFISLNKKEIYNHCKKELNVWQNIKYHLNLY